MSYYCHIGALDLYWVNCLVWESNSVVRCQLPGIRFFKSKLWNCLKWFSSEFLRIAHNYRKFLFRWVVSAALLMILGILLDENLSFKHHTSQIKMKISRKLGILRKLTHILPGSILKISFSLNLHILIHFYVSYYIIIWIPTFSSLLIPLPRVYDEAKNLILAT